jgi:hypothetical protein
MSQVPSVCRLVHYVSYGTPGGEYHSQCRAAVIAEVGQWITTQVTTVTETSRVLQQDYDPEACALTVFNPTGVFFNGAYGISCKHSEDDHRGGTWHWPERVGDG